MASGNGRAAGPGKSDAILAEFTRQVAENGYEGTSFGSIAKELGISQGLISHHYGTKDALFTALRLAYTERRVEDARRIIAQFGSPAERLAGLLYELIMLQVVDRNATVAFQREVARFAKEIKEDDSSPGSKLNREFFGIVREVLDAGIASGEFRAVDANARILLILGAAHWSWTWFDPAGRRRVEDVGAELVDLVLGSVLVSRRRLARLADPDGVTATTVRDILAGTDSAAGEAAESGKR